MKMAATYWRSRSHPSNFLHLKWIGDCSACCQMKSNSISNNTPKRVGHNFVETCCFCAARNFVLSIPYVCVCFSFALVSKLKSKTWPAVEKMETAFVYNAFELSKVQGPSEIQRSFRLSLWVCVWRYVAVCVCVSHQAVNTLPLTRAPGFESSTSFTAPPTLCCCLSERKSLRCKLQSFEQLFHLHRLCKLQQQKLLKVYRIIGAMAIFKPSLSNYSCNMGKQRGKLSDKRAYATSVFHLSMLWIKSLRRA